MPRVSIIESNQTLEVKGDLPLYDAICDQGITLPHGCLAGSCGACRIDVKSGAENLSPPGVIELNTLEGLKEEFRQKYGEDFLKGKNIRLACRACIKGDVSFDLIK